MKKVVLVFTMLLTVSLITVSCSKQLGGDNTPEIGGMEGAEGPEGGNGEGSEGSGGEGADGSNGEGSEGSGGEGGNESGMLWNATDTADEIVNGIHLILSYDQATESFVGTLENINTNTAPQVRVEVHVFDAAGNSTEFGPTTPADMVPGEIRDVSLPIAAGTTFTQFNMHPEVGTASAGG